MSRQEFDEMKTFTDDASSVVSEVDKEFRLVEGENFLFHLFSDVSHEILYAHDDHVWMVGKSEHLMRDEFEMQRGWNICIR